MAWRELELAFQNGLILTDSNVDIEYKLYYNTKGDIVASSMIKDDPDVPNLPFVVVDENIYKNYFRFEVIDGQIEERLTKSGHKVSYVKSSKGKITTAKNNLAILVDIEDNITEVDRYVPRSDRNQ